MRQSLYVCVSVQQVTAVECSGCYIQCDVADASAMSGNGDIDMERESEEAEAEPAGAAGTVFALARFTSGGTLCDRV